MNTETLRHILASRRFAVITSTIVSACVSSTAVYFLTKNHLEEKYRKISEEEIQEAKIFYQKREKTGDFADPSVLAEKYEGETASENPDFDPDTEMVVVAKKILENQEYVSYDKPPTTKEEAAEVKASIAKNIFDNRDPIDEAEVEFDLEMELDKKSRGEPYILEHDEYYENDSGYVQTTLTYYEEDDVLADEDDSPIRNIESVIGSNNLRFGYGSHDGNTVLIRNDKLEGEYEVVRSTGSFAKEVHGFIKHEDRPRLRKFRVAD